MNRETSSLNSIETITATIKKELQALYDDVIELRNRLSPDGSGETYQEDHLLLDRVLDLLEEHIKVSEKFL